jgi:hypothetical protein
VCNAMPSRWWLTRCSKPSSLSGYGNERVGLHPNEHKGTRSPRCNSVQIFLVNDWHRTHAETIFDVNCGWRSRKACFALLKAGDGFGFGLSSTKWIFVGTDGR